VNTQSFEWDQLPKVLHLLAWVILAVIVIGILPIGGVFQPIVVEQLVLVYVYPLFLAAYLGFKRRQSTRKEYLVTLVVFIALGSLPWLWRWRIPFNDSRSLLSSHILYATLCAAFPYCIKVSGMLKNTYQVLLSYTLSVVAMVSGSSIS